MIKDDQAAQLLKSTFAHTDRLASLGTLAASMAHEVKNALVSVRTFIDLLLEKDPGAELGQLVRRELDRIQCLVTNTLKFAGPAIPSEPWSPCTLPLTMP